MRSLVVVIFLFAVQFSLLRGINNEGVFSEKYDSPAPPSWLLKVLAADHQGLVAGYYYLEALTYWGTVIEEGRSGKSVKEWRGQLLHFLDLCKTAMEVDSAFIDPYYIANAHLPWEGFASSVNMLMERGMEARYWDWQLQFYAAFNSYYFLGEHDRSVRYLQDAQKVKGAPSFLVSLASRFAYEGSETLTAMQFLSSQIQTEQNENLKKHYLKRFESMRAIYEIEVAVREYIGRYSQIPKSIQELVACGILTLVPSDPYGGTYYLDGKKVKTTSDMKDVLPQNFDINIFVDTVK